jgi:hypothetical protein
VAESGRKLVLGFIGGDKVHRDNAIALLEDLITVHLRNNKGADVVMYLGADPFSMTMADLADYCLTSGYKLGLVGTDEDLAGPASAFVADAAGFLIRVTPPKKVSFMLVSTLSTYANEARLILVADPNEDDDAYNAVIQATGLGIKVRTLLGGLDEVTLEDDEPEEKPAVAAAPDPVPEEDEYQDEEDLGAEPDLEALSDDAVVEVEDIVDAELVDLEPEPEPATEEVEEPNEEQPEPVATPTAEKTKTKATKRPAKAKAVALTGDQLAALYAEDRSAFYELAAGFDVFPGKGLKVPTLVGRILEKSGGAPMTEVRVPAKRVAAKKAAPAKAAAPAKKAPVKKAAASNNIRPKETLAIKTPTGAGVGKKKAAGPKVDAKVATTNDSAPIQYAVSKSNAAAIPQGVQELLTAAAKLLEVAAKLLER